MLQSDNPKVAGKHYPIEELLYYFAQVLDKKGKNTFPSSNDLRASSPFLDNGGSSPARDMRYTKYGIRNNACPERAVASRRASSPENNQGVFQKKPVYEYAVDWICRKLEVYGTCSPQEAEDIARAIKEGSENEACSRLEQFGVPRLGGSFNWIIDPVSQRIRFQPVYEAAKSGVKVEARVVGFKYQMSNKLFLIKVVDDERKRHAKWVELMPNFVSHQVACAHFEENDVVMLFPTVVDLKFGKMKVMWSVAQGQDSRASSSLGESGCSLEPFDNGGSSPARDMRYTKYGIRNNASSPSLDNGGSSPAPQNINGQPSLPSVEMVYELKERIHLRLASVIAKYANIIDRDLGITLTITKLPDEGFAYATSINHIMMLGIREGDRLRLEAESSGGNLGYETDRTVFTKALDIMKRLINDYEALHRPGKGTYLDEIIDLKIEIEKKNYERRKFTTSERGLHSRPSADLSDIARNNPRAEIWIVLPVQMQIPGSIFNFRDSIGPGLEVEFMIRTKPGNKPLTGEEIEDIFQAIEAVFIRDKEFTEQDKGGSDLAAGEPLSPFRKNILKTLRVALRPFYGVFPKIKNVDEHIDIFRQRLRESDIPLLLLDYFAKTGRIRAGPRWLKGVFKCLGIQAFNYHGWIIIDPAILNNPQTFQKVLIHEIGAIFGLHHLINNLLEKMITGEAASYNIEDIKIAISFVERRGRIGKSIDLAERVERGQENFDSRLGVNYEIEPISDDLMNKLPGMTRGERMLAIIDERGFEYPNHVRIKSGIKSSTFSSMINSDRIPLPRNLYAVSKVLKVDPILIVEGEPWPVVREKIDDARKLILHRLRRGMTQIELALALEKEGLMFDVKEEKAKRSTIAQWERGNRPSQEARRLIRRFFNDDEIFITPGEKKPKSIKPLRVKKLHKLPQAPVPIETPIPARAPIAEQPVNTIAKKSAENLPQKLSEERKPEKKEKKKPDSRIEALYEKAKKCLRDRDFKGAIEAADQALAIDKELRYIAIIKARALINIKGHGEAERREEAERILNCVIDDLDGKRNHKKEFDNPYDAKDYADAELTLKGMGYLSDIQAGATGMTPKDKIHTAASSDLEASLNSCMDELEGAVEKEDAQRVGGLLAKVAAIMHEKKEKEGPFTLSLMHRLTMEKAGKFLKERRKHLQEGNNLRKKDIRASSPESFDNGGFSGNSLSLPANIYKLGQRAMLNLPPECFGDTEIPVFENKIGRAKNPHEALVSSIGICFLVAAFNNTTNERVLIHFRGIVPEGSNPGQFTEELLTPILNPDWTRVIIKHR
ncbi:MAG: HPr family phosphocarrier protein, partial [Candidatus Omnitrophica bacterium]|nr:HPr family phosphocarrier protein [Candidatus Omnitrophota bacterium]